MDINELAELYVSGFWVWLGLSFGVCAVLNFIFKMHNRTLRAWNIRKHGYPSGDLIDADGDIVHPEKCDCDA